MPIVEYYDLRGRKVSRTVFGSFREFISCLESLSSDEQFVVRHDGGGRCRVLRHNLRNPMASQGMNGELQHLPEILARLFYGIPHVEPSAEEYRAIIDSLKAELAAIKATSQDNGEALAKVLSDQEWAAQGGE